MMLFSLAFVCTAGIRAQERSTKDRNQTIKVDVDLVLVNATVSDSKGRMVTGLEQENFRIWEDKVEQKVEYFSSEDTPMSIGLIFDASLIKGQMFPRCPACYALTVWDFMKRKPDNRFDTKSSLPRP